MFLYRSSAIRPAGCAVMSLLLFTATVRAQQGKPPGDRAPQVVVRAVNGRIYEGALGVSLQPDEIVLKNRSGNMTATTVIPQSNVVSISPASPMSAAFAGADSTEERAQARQSVGLTVQERQPQWIEATARLSNHDADAEADGIEVRVVGMTPGGAVPLHGSVDIHLEGLLKPRPDMRARRKTIERWTMPIGPLQRQAADIILLLPFRGSTACDWRLYEWARVRVRVNTPAVGSWDSQTPVPLRSLGPFHAELLRQQALWTIRHGSQPIR